MEFDFKNRSYELSNIVAKEANERIEELEKRHGTISFGSDEYNEVLNEMIHVATGTCTRLLEEYHNSLMTFLAQKGVL